VLALHQHDGFQSRQTRADVEKGLEETGALDEGNLGLAVLGDELTLIWSVVGVDTGWDRARRRDQAWVGLE